MTIYPVARLPDAWIEEARTQGAYVDLSLKSPWQLFAAFDKSEPGGFIGLLLTGKRSAHIRGWYVFPEHRNAGIGGQLLTHALDWSRVNGYHNLEIRTARHIDWTGFVPTGYQRQHGRKEAAYVMEIVA